MTMMIQDLTPTHAEDPISMRLKAIVAGAEVPTDLEVLYDETHGLWGEFKIIIRGDGSVQCRERRVYKPGKGVTHAFINSQQIINLLGLLIEQRVWEQHMPRRNAVPDETIAVLRVSVGGLMASMWELNNDMAENKRLILIKNEMERLAEGE